MIIAINFILSCFISVNANKNEIKILELYGENNYDCLGENHGDSLSGYLNRFLGDNAKMDVKMVQQWELFGDPSLKIGGYDKS